MNNQDRNAPPAANGERQLHSQEPNTIIDSLSDSSSSACEGGAVVGDPRPTDVVLGRGKGASSHEGNQQFQLLIQRHAHEYNGTSSRYKKTRIARDVVRAVRKRGRFLKYVPESDHWVEVDKFQARTKASQALRYCHRKVTKNCVQGKQEAKTATSNTTTTSLHSMASSLHAAVAASSQQQSPLLVSGSASADEEEFLRMLKDLG